MVVVQVFGDTEFERDEQIRLTILGSDLPDFEGGLSAFGTIVNDDEGTLVLVGDASVLEGGEGEQQFALFTVTLSGALPAEPLRVFYQTLDGEAKSFNDFEPVFEALDFAPGETEKTIEVRVFGDFEREGNEQFYLQLFDPSLPNTLTGAPGTGTIQDDDGPQVFISGGTVLEGDAGLRTIRFDVSLQGEPVFEGRCGSRSAPPMAARLPARTTWRRAASSPSCRGRRSRCSRSR